MFEKFRSFNTYTHDFLVQGFTILLSLSFPFTFSGLQRNKIFQEKVNEFQGLK